MRKKKKLFWMRTSGNEFIPPPPSQYSPGKNLYPAFCYAANYVHENEGGSGVGKRLRMRSKK